MSDDLKKGEWGKSKFLDMMKEYPETIAKLNEKTVKLLTEQLNSGEEVDLFKKEMDKKKLVNSSQFIKDKKILFAYDVGATLDDIDSFVAQNNKKNEAMSMLGADDLQDDQEQLGYNTPNIVEKPKTNIIKTISKNLVHVGKLWVKEGWNIDVDDFFNEGLTKELSSFTRLVGTTYNDDSRFKNNYDGVFSKILGNTETQFSNIIDNIVTNCIRAVTKNKEVQNEQTENKEVATESNLSVISNSVNIDIPKLKQKQLEIILKNNPMKDTYHTGIRNIDDILTAYEAFMTDDNIMDDFTKEDAMYALKTKKVNVYSSYPIKPGVFVTTSRKEAQTYAGGGMIYSKKASIYDVAWIDDIQGQYAPVSDNIVGSSILSDIKSILSYEKVNVNYIFTLDDSIYDNYEISNIENVKKFNVLINFTDFLINKWTKNALINEMKKNKTSGEYYGSLLIQFINNINYIIKNKIKNNGEPKTPADLAIESVTIYENIGDLSKAFAFMLYIIYIAKNRYDNNYTNYTNNKNLNFDIDSYKLLGNKIIKQLNGNVNGMEITNKNINIKLKSENNNTIIFDSLFNNKKINIKLNWYKFLNNIQSFATDSNVVKFINDINEIISSNENDIFNIIDKFVLSFDTFARNDRLYVGNNKFVHSGLEINISN